MEGAVEPWLRGRYVLHLMRGCFVLHFGVLGSLVILKRKQIQIYASSILKIFVLIHNVFLIIVNLKCNYLWIKFELHLSLHT